MSDLTTKDRDHLIAIVHGGHERRKALQEIYENSELHQRAKEIILANSGSIQDSIDVIHDAIIVLDRNIRQQKFRMEGPILHYLISICRLLWMNRMRKKIRSQRSDIPNSVTSEVDPEKLLFDKEQKKNLDLLLSRMDEKCLKILTLWKQSYSMEEIAGAMQLSSARLARKYRYRCAQKMLNLLEEDQDLFELLRELR